jgi:hypothetical protein
MRTRGEQGHALRFSFAGICELTLALSRSYIGDELRLETRVLDQFRGGFMRQMSVAGRFRDR